MAHGTWGGAVLLSFAQPHDRLDSFLEAISVVAAPFMGSIICPCASPTPAGIDKPDSYGAQ